MNIKDIYIEAVYLNGEELYIVDSKKFNYLKEEKIVENISIGGEFVLNLLNGLMDFVLEQSNFELGMYKYKIGNTKIRWMFVILYKLKSGWQRVHLESVICQKCNWNGKIANPTETSLYDTIVNKFEILDEVWKIPKVNCPKCGADLPRYAIWTDENS